MWYWHSPFDLDSGQEAELAKLGVKELFVRAATLSFDGDHVVPILHQTWRSKATIHLVYNFDAGMIRHFEEISESEIARTLVSQVQRDTQASGGTVHGVQIDFDCPSRLLWKYAQLTKMVKALLPKNLALSATGLTSWIGRKGLADMVSSLDFFVPQFYEGELPRRIDQPKPLTDLRRLNSQLDALGRLPKPVRIGVPSYGQCLLYDEAGNLAGIYRGLSRREACRHPLMTFEKSLKVDGEEQTIFRAVKNGKKYSLLYRMSTPQLVSQFLETIQRRRPANCKGAILFRMPAKEEGMAVPLVAIRQAVNHESVVEKISARWTVKPVPFATIERGAPMLFEATLTFRNEGNASIPFSPDAIESEIRTTQPVSEASPGEFDRLEKAVTDLSLARTRQFRARRSGLDPGETACVGPFLVSDGEISADWSYASQNGKRIRRVVSVNVGKLMR